jgi:hypothetical protein
MRHISLLRKLSHTNTNIFIASFFFWDFRP